MVESVTAVALPSVFDAEVGVTRAEGLACLERHGVGSKSGSTERTGACGFGLPAIPRETIHRRWLSRPGWGGSGAAAAAASGGDNPDGAAEAGNRS